MKFNFLFISLNLTAWILKKTQLRSASIPSLFVKSRCLQKTRRQISSSESEEQNTTT